MTPARPSTCLRQRVMEGLRTTEGSLVHVRGVGAYRLETEQYDHLGEAVPIDYASTRYGWRATLLFRRGRALLPREVRVSWANTWRVDVVDVAYYDAGRIYDLPLTAARAVVADLSADPRLRDTVTRALARRPWAFGGAFFLRPGWECPRRASQVAATLREIEAEEQERGRGEQESAAARTRREQWADAISGSGVGNRLAVHGENGAPAFAVVFSELRKLIAVDVGAL